MKKKGRFAILNILLSLLIMVLFSCGFHQKSDNHPIPTLNPDQVRNQKNIFMSEMATKGELVELETVPDSYIKYLTDYHVGKDFILIADNTIPKVSLYNRQGKFLYNIGSFGKGPGEYSRLVELCVNEDQGLIYLYSFYLARISIYKLNGEWIKDYNTRDLCSYPMIDVMEIVGNNLVLVLRRPPVELEDFYQVWFFDQNLNFLEKQKPIPSNEMSGFDMQESIRSNQFNDGLVYLDYYGDTVFFIDENRKIEPMLHLDYGRMPTEMAQKEGVFNKQQDFTKMIGITSAPPLLLFSFLQKAKDILTIFFNCNNQEMGILADSDCPTQLIQHGLVNDITGITPYQAGKYFHRGFVARVIERWIIDGYVKPECIEEMSRTYPNQMNRYKEVFSLDKVDQNPVIEIIQLQGN